MFGLTVPSAVISAVAVFSKTGQFSKPTLQGGRPRAQADGKVASILNSSHAPAILREHQELSLPQRQPAFPGKVVASLEAMRPMIGNETGAPYDKRPFVNR
jgi:hypothetical protein